MVVASASFHSTLSRPDPSPFFLFSSTLFLPGPSSGILHLDSWRRKWRRDSSPLSSLLFIRLFWFRWQDSAHLVDNCSFWIVYNMRNDELRSTEWFWNVDITSFLSFFLFSGFLTVLDSKKLLIKGLRYSYFIKWLFEDIRRKMICEVRFIEWFRRYKGMLREK